MISEDNNAEVLNESMPLPNRASKLVDLVTTRVKLIKEDYRTFVALLRRNQPAYRPILVICKFVPDDYYRCNSEMGPPMLGPPPPGPYH